MMWNLPVLSFLFIAVSGRWVKRGELDVDQAGFLNVYEHRNYGRADERYSLLAVSWFPVPIADDYLFMFPYIGQHFSNLTAAESRILSESPLLISPREPSQVPYEVFGFDAVAMPDGFLIPGKTDGAVNIIDLRDPDLPLTYAISGDTEDRFYHRVTWIDMDKDGDLDIFTCRAYVVPSEGIQITETLWFEHPGTDVFDDPWTSHFLMDDACDTFSVRQVLTADNVQYEAIFTIGYFTNKLMVHWTRDPQGRWTDTSLIESRVIEDLGLIYFDLIISDLNLDGRLDLLVSQCSNTNGSLLVFEIPDDFRTGTYVRHVLAYGFRGTSGAGVATSPGFAKPFYPNQNTTGNPWIALTGDDEGTFYIFTPQAAPWQYNIETVIDEGEGSIVAGLSIFDADGDGTNDLFVGSYYEGKVYSYYWQPS